MPLSLIFKIVTGSLAAMVRSIFAMLRAIPTPVYAVVGMTLTILLAVLLIKSHNENAQLKTQQKRLTAQIGTLTAQAQACSDALTKQNQAVASLAKSAQDADKRANEALKRAHTETQSLRDRIADLRRRPPPPPAQVCEASDALLNEFIP